MKKALVVDDAGISDKVSAAMLKRIGFEALSTRSSNEAIEMCRENFPDCILVGEKLSDTSGFNFLEELRKMPGGDKPQVIFCVGQHDALVIAKALHDGANEYLVKPFERKDLEEKLQEVGLL